LGLGARKCFRAPFRFRGRLRESIMKKQHLLVSTFVSVLALMPVSASAQLFGPSDEEKAREAAQDGGIRDLMGQTQQQDTRLRALEDKVRTLTDSLARATGANEELNHQIQMQTDKIDAMQKDFAYRLCTLSAQQMGATDTLNCTGAGAASASAAPPFPNQRGPRPGDALPPIDATGQGPGGFVTPPSGAVPYSSMGRPPGTLGTLPMGSGPRGLGPGPMASSDPGLNGSLASGDTGQYDQAMNLMSRAQYAEAQAAFRAYADANPSDTDLAPQAIYWVGNISFVRQEYAPAARSFAEVIKKYPKSGRAPDAMLKLAQSFMGMGQKTEGCTTLGLIKTKYPQASPGTLAQAANLRKTACSK
jgi:tol-pal system protein YbgF